MIALSMQEYSVTAVETRNQHIGHESSVRGIGLLYYFASVCCGTTGLLLAVLALWWGSAPVGVVVVAVVAAVISVLLWVLARGVRSLSPWSRTPATILACIGLIGFPLGTLINGYILFLLHSEKGRTVFSHGYSTVVQQTPEIRYKTQLIVWAVLCLVLLAFAIGITIAASRVDWSARVTG